MQRIAALVCSAVFLVACGGGGGDDGLEDPVWVTEGQVVDTNGVPVSDATVAVELDRLYSTSTDSSGRFTLRTPRNYNYPEYFAGYAQKVGYVPGQIFFWYQGGNLASSAAGRAVSTPAATTQDVILPTGVNVIHLGDDNFAGSANSQFQKRSLGLYWEDHFNLTTATSSMCVSFYAKGIETRSRTNNVVSISNNGQPGTFQVADLIDSPASGSYEKQTHCFSLQGFQAGDRIRVAINSGIASNGDYDDFEFLGVAAKLSSPTGTGSSTAPIGSAGDITGGRWLFVDVATEGWFIEYSIPQAQAAAAQGIGADNIGYCTGLYTAWTRATNTMLPQEDLALKLFGGVATPGCLRAPNWPAFDAAVRNSAATCSTIPSLGTTVLTSNWGYGIPKQPFIGQIGPENWSTVINQLVSNRASDEAACAAAGGK